MGTLLITIEEFCRIETGFDRLLSVNRAHRWNVSLGCPRPPTRSVDSIPDSEFTIDTPEANDNIIETSAHATESSAHARRLLDWDATTGGAVFYICSRAWVRV